MKQTNYHNNYQIINGPSYINMDQKKIVLEIPLANDTFTIKKTYNLSNHVCTTILVHLTDGTNRPLKDVEVANYIKNLNLDFDELGLDPSTISPQGIQVIVYNDMPKDFSDEKLRKITELISKQGYLAFQSLCDDKTDNKMNDENIFLPNEGCGGVLSISV